MRLSLNPCSNGMKIEFDEEQHVAYGLCLNPCSNGMKIEFCKDVALDVLKRVLILVLME